MSFSERDSIELAPTTTKVPVPFVVVFDKRSRPDNRGGIKQVYLLASLKTQRERKNVARGLPFAERDPREARERAGKGGPGRTIKCVTRQRP